MGLRHSITKLPEPSPNVPIFAMTFRKPDTITLVLADDTVVSCVSNVCKQTWTRGFEFIGKQADGSFQLVCKGNPFLVGERREYAEAIKRLCCRLLSELFALGFECVLASDLSRHTDFTTWFFERRAATDDAPTPNIICLSLSSTDSIQLFNGNQLLKTALRNAVIESYGPGIEQERTYDDDQTDDEYYEIKLCGSPWFTTVFDLSIWARKVILAIFEAFHRCNFEYYISANLKGMADSIFFIYDETAAASSSRRPSMYGYRDDDVKFCLISLNGNNRLRLLNCPREMIDLTARTIGSNWPYGFKRQLDVADVVREFELGGFPWWASNGDAIASRAFLAQLFENYLESGWRVVCSLDISRRANDKSIFILQSRSPMSIHHFCISYNDIDKIRIIKAKPKLSLMIEKIIIGNWPKGIKRELDYCNSREIKLRGAPFEPLTPNEASLVRVLMCYLLNRLHRTGCRVIASSDVSAKFHHKGSSGPNYPFDVHTWFTVSRH